MQLRDIAHARAGDKGTVVTIAVIARRPEDYPIIEERVTAERVTKLFGPWLWRPAVRYSIAHLAALNFVLERSPTQSVTRSLALDAHGKCLSSVLLDIEI